jgi:peptidoglycan/xylan/chitin deacetylase (PgdA/CDA1 family)
MNRIKNLILMFPIILCIFLFPIIGVYASPVNLIGNPSTETTSISNTSLPLNWLQGSWGTNSHTFSYVKGGAQDGNYSLKVQISKYTNGDAKWYFAPVNVTPGSQYNFSDYYISNISSSIIVQYQTSTGVISYQNLGIASVSSAWTQYKNTFTIPSNVSQMTVFHLISSVGSLQTDNYSLSLSTPTSTPTINITSPSPNSSLSGNVNIAASASDTNGISYVKFNLDGSALGGPISSSPFQYTWNTIPVANGSHIITATATNTLGISSTSAPVTININNPVSTPNLINNPLVNIVSPTNSSSPSNWSQGNWGVNAASFSYPTSGYLNSRSLNVSISSYTSGDAKWSFDPIIAAADQQYKFSEYYQSNVNTQVDAVFNMNDGTTIYQMIGQPYASSNWTNFTTNFSIPLGTKTFTIYHVLQSVGYLNTSNFNLTTYSPIGFSRPLVSLTFDDGYDNEYTQAFPLLNKYGLSSTQFIITNVLNTQGYMTNAQILAMYMAGNEIASHTVTHNDLSQETQAQLLLEMAPSQSIIQSIIGAPVTDLAYPYGTYNSSVVSAAQAVYAAARGVEDGFNSKDNYNPYNIKAQNVYNTTTTAQISDWIYQAKITNTWLVLVYHSVNPDISAGIYNVTPSQLDQQLSAIKSSGIKVETMKQAITEITPQL